MHVTAVKVCKVDVAIEIIAQMQKLLIELQHI